jgi:hypothetical protein
MPHHARVPRFRREPSSYSDHVFGWPERDFELSDDLPLEVAYVVSEWAITFVGPTFWICLIYLFFVAELDVLH